jgi:hypothetical protein
MSWGAIWVAATHYHLLPVCKERKRLRGIYSRAVSVHARAVSEIIAVRGKVSKEEYDRL